MSGMGPVMAGRNRLLQRLGAQAPERPLYDAMLRLDATTVDTP